MILLAATAAQAQIKIGGKVFGGGNAGEMTGNTKVTVCAGDINEVYGGARKANVGGNAFVHIDGEHTVSDSYILINRVYGGNDITGKIGENTTTKHLPRTYKAVANGTTLTSGKKYYTSAQGDGEFTSNGTETANGSNFFEPVPILTHASENNIDDTWNACVRVSSVKTTTTTGDNPTTTVTNNKVYIGQLFGGGNGDYNNTDTGDTKKPELAKTYLEVAGGSIIWAFGGGNNATVTERTVICVNNPSEVVSSIKENGVELLTNDRVIKMGVNPGLANANSEAFQIGSFFGGNNKAPMHIRPTWNLIDGKIRNLYSGGNAGDMTAKDGLLLEIGAKEQDGRLVTSNIKVDNVYGGCRKADVHPLKDDLISELDMDDPIQLEDKYLNGNLKYQFPAGLSARVLVRSGQINNVYGGNDISGRVFGGNAVGVYTSITGDIYGGGNGSYPYTDNDELINDPTYGDFYYKPSDVFSNAGVTPPTDEDYTSVEALNLFRPNAEQVSIRVAGTEDNKTVIGGAIYCGGNSATLKTTKEKPMVELKIGSYVIADEVFLGNNGVNMVKSESGDNVLQVFKSTDKTSNGTKFNSMKLTEPDVFAKYMEGCAMDLIPKIVFDDKEKDDPETYKEYTTYFGSLYLGGNVGSMTYPSTNNMDFSTKIVIFNKVVGGCNNANVNQTDYNAKFEGGVTTALTAEEKAANPNKLVLNFRGLKLEPKRWNSDKTGLEWNTVKWVTANNTLPTYQEVTTTTDVIKDYERRLNGGNVYGGCYSSGHVNGNVEINIEADLVDRSTVFATAEVDSDGEIVEDADGHESISSDTSKPRNSGVLLDEQANDVLGSALNVFGAGYGKNTEIWGSTTINVKNGYVFQVFGGGEMGYVGQKAEVTHTDETTTMEYVYNPAYSATINLCGDEPGTKDNDVAEVEYIYGGGYEGDVCGNTQVNLGNGRIFDAFGGACNADVLGYTSVYVGGNGEYEEITDDAASDEENNTYKKYKVYGFPWVRDNVYGGNDFGGKMHKSNNYSDFVKPSTKAKMFEMEGRYSEGKNKLLESYTYVAYIQGRVDSIFGGNYGYYHYADNLYNKYTYGESETGMPSGKVSGDPRVYIIDDTYTVQDPIYDGQTDAKQFYKPYLDNSFVNFTPNSNSANEVGSIFGGSQGFPNEVTNNNSMQELSYVLVDGDNYAKGSNMLIYGAGAYGGLGSPIGAFKGSGPGKGTAVIDLISGNVGDVFGASHNEGLVGTTYINVPVGSKIQANNIYGGAYGASDKQVCDVTSTNIYFNSSDARAEAIFGGNNSHRRSVNTIINIESEVKNKAGEYIDIYGAGLGPNTWAECTTVNLKDNAKVKNVYGGGYNGRVLNRKSLQYWKTQYDDLFFVDATAYGDVTLSAGTHNTNINIAPGAEVTKSVYGGGYGALATVVGETAVNLNGGKVTEDIFGGGYGGDVQNIINRVTYTENTTTHELEAHNEYPVVVPTENSPIAATYVNLNGGSVRNVYGGGYDGHIGSETVENGVTNIQIGKQIATNITTGLPIPGTFTDGTPAIEYSAYGGGYRGAVYGTANIRMDDGYIGYKYDASTGKYVENINYPGDTRMLLKENGNLFGAGFGEGATVDITRVKLYDGHIRNSLYGGGEIAAVGRGTVNADGVTSTITRGGHTYVEMYGGKVDRNVFGGGRGYAIDAYGQTMSGEFLRTDGYTFGSTDVQIYRGTIGTSTTVDEGDGNVFGGGNIGYVYTATGTKKSDGYYYDADNKTRDCRVIIAPKCKVEGTGVLKNAINKELTIKGELTNFKYDANDVLPMGTIRKLLDTKDDTSGESVLTPEDYTFQYDGIIHEKTVSLGDYVETAELNLMNNADEDWKDLDDTGINIGNAVFAGGNVSTGSTIMYANTKTVFGNVVASVTDIFSKDFITIGEDGIGGLYGDGNLTFVDGYRGLNITNYGTDYYNLNSSLTYEEYQKLNDRERAYFELEYQPKEKVGNHSYSYYECKHTHTYVYTDEDNNEHKVQFKRGQKLPRSSSDDLSKISYNGTLLNYNREHAIETSAGVSSQMKQTDYWWKIDHHEYAADAKIKEEEYNLMDDEEKGNWNLYGFCTLYAGRMINTIQRADFCGVFGSRVVLRGAHDRVTTSADYTEYTINRVNELSLNKSMDQAAPLDETLAHGNYFGIYNVVNYLGALTSDVQFTSSDFDGAAIRKTNNSESGYTADNHTTYYEWKQDNLNNRKRNNGSCHNQVALASGVWLEILKEETETAGHKVYGPITGVVELALINVATGEGGGYVYAENQHGQLESIDPTGQLLLSDANKHAVTYKQFHYANPMSVQEAEEKNRNHRIDYTYTDDKNVEHTIKVDAEGYVTTYEADYHPINPKMQTSGNFINSFKRIVDDCYPLSGAYMGADASPAHYWYIRGDFYVYDQYISAYTGSAQAYAEQITIPLTITAEAQGRLTLNSVDQNRYAYWDGDLATNNTVPSQYKSVLDETAILVGGVSYHKNDPITYWDWSRLSPAEQALFEEKTYTCTTAVTYNDGTETKTYAKGDPILQVTFDGLPTDQYVVKYEFKVTGANDIITEYPVGTILGADEYDTLSKECKKQCITVKECFNVSNSISHDTGFLLTLDWDNPEKWNKYYQDPDGKLKNTDDNYKQRVDSKTWSTFPKAIQDKYTPGPTFRCDVTDIYGQKDYIKGAIIDKDVYDSQAQIATDLTTNGVTDPRTSQEDYQAAAFAVAYVAKADCKTSNGNAYVKGACISVTEYGALTTDADKALFEVGKLCTESYLPDGQQEILYGEVVPLSVYNALPPAVRAKHFKDAYVCTTPGKWGGSLFIKDINYAAQKWSNLDATERYKFSYNYDAFDLLSEYFLPGNATHVVNNETETIPLTWYEGELHDITINGDSESRQVLGEQIPYAQPNHLIDYTATYTGANMTSANKLKETVTVTRKSGETTTSLTTDMLETGDVLSNIVYESLTNEQFKYTPIIATGKDDTDKVFYVVKEGFQVGDNWYSAGNQISEDVYESMTETNQSRYIARIPRSSLVGETTLGENDQQRYYFCTRSYKAVTSVTDLLGDKNTYTSSTADVPVGTVISAENYGLLINEHVNFSIDGKIPNTTSTLYVSREVDIDKLQQDKVVTVAYIYEYIESDEDGRSYETIRERHVINVHIHFESGVPTIGELFSPTTVLPGQTSGLNQPTVSKGAFEILGGGWEMYTNETDATTHTNGAEYESGKTPMYWYQDGYWVAYYAKTYLGRTYSNPVQFSVANYHRMADVLASKDKDDENNHYMYLNEAVKANKRDPKIYIGSSTELDNFKSFYDLTKAATAATNEDFSNITDCQNLDFFLDDEIKHTGTWTSVGDEGHCFQGNFHGDGHAITGMTSSLFNWLCGDVYNTGVAGSFTGAGIAENGDGYVQNCWIKTTADPTSGAGHYPVFGNPDRNADAIAEHGEVQVENCYYPESNNYYVTYPEGYNKGKPIQKPNAAFVDGEVAYDLNSFYLTKRYYNKYAPSEGEPYKYWERDAAGVEGSTPIGAYYPAGTNNTYVEDRYKDVDFLYADGIVPNVGTINKRFNAPDGKYYPIYPDDYIFFAQNLSYDHEGDAAHDEHPVAVMRNVATEEQKDNDRLLLDNNNRVYRAPGYYRSKMMGSVHFNKKARFNGVYTTKADGIFGTDDIHIYDELTAIDFTGTNDDTWHNGTLTEGFAEGRPAFFPRLFDYDGLTAFSTDGITYNLLVYADNENDATSHNILSTALPEATYTFNTVSGHEYNNVPVPADASSVRGHLVSWNGTEFKATRNHYLVDNHDFNAPISYTFDNNHRMWYQRRPTLYASYTWSGTPATKTTKGWEGISLPFKAEYVTTDVKGEITHFYGSSSSVSESGSKRGHEYWLRHFKNGGKTTEIDSKPVYEAKFDHPGANNDDAPKDYTNTFLWDYYYSYNNRDDANADDYQEGEDYQDVEDNAAYTYYKKERTYKDYPRLAAATPYIIGFPGQQYYEFDLSGNFTPNNTAGWPTEKTLKKQTISFVSETRITIDVSDVETGDAATSNTHDGYTFTPSYMRQTLASVAANDNDSPKSYVLNNDGSAYEAVIRAADAPEGIGNVDVPPFRPYFTSGAGTSPSRRTRAIVFSNDQSELKGVEEHGDPSDASEGSLDIHAKKHKVVVTSNLRYITEVRIVNAAGVTVNTFSIEPGETVETRIYNGGVYIVQTTDGRHNKKLAVK